MATLEQRVSALETKMAALIAFAQNVKDAFEAYREKQAQDRTRDAQALENAKRRLRRRLQ